MKANENEHFMNCYRLVFMCSICTKLNNTMATMAHNHPNDRTMKWYTIHVFVLYDKVLHFGQRLRRESMALKFNLCYKNTHYKLKLHTKAKQSKQNYKPEKRGKRFTKNYSEQYQNYSQSQKLLLGKW